MSGIDYAILVGFMLWMLGIGAVFSWRVKNSADMFSAGGQSPWWIAGLSGFMTIFSAGTFVVWGGIAYRLGLVAVSLLTVTGLSAVLVGVHVAGRWRRMGITTPTEYLRIRFNEAVVQVYTWVGIVLRGIGLAVGLYALAVMLSALVNLPEGAPFRDAETGNLSVNWSIILWGAIVIAYTMAGGLWAVMMTDVIQCIILCLLVLVAVPLSLSNIGGVETLWNKAPPEFFSPASGGYTYSFLFLWFWLGFFRYASDWAFVQRYICVPTPGDARKTAFLMGGLYIVSPLLWMLPAMAYRIVQPDGGPEIQKTAYVLMCQRVLPAGMLGIMMAAMFSATASMVSSLLNVFAGVFACDVYRPLINPQASEKQLVLVGRLATLIYGSTIVGLALAVPFLGGPENMVISLVTSLMGPLFLPVVWGLYSRRINQRAIWATLAICATATTTVKVTAILVKHEILSQAWADSNSRMTDAFLGLILPLGVLAVAEFLCWARGVDSGWTKMEAEINRYEDRPTVAASSRLPSQIVAASLGMLGLTMGIVTSLATEQRTTLAIFTAMLLVTAVAIGWFSSRRPVAS